MNDASRVVSPFWPLNPPTAVSPEASLFYQEHKPCDCCDYSVSTVATGDDRCDCNADRSPKAAAISLTLPEMAIDTGPNMRGLSPGHDSPRIKTATTMARLGEFQHPLHPDWNGTGPGRRGRSSQSSLPPNAGIAPPCLRLTPRPRTPAGEQLPYKTGATPENDRRMTIVLLIRKLGELPSFFNSGLVVVGREKSVPLSNFASS